MKRLGAIVIAIEILSGCGDGPAVICGPGTELIGNSCVPAGTSSDATIGDASSSSGFECGEGTVEEDGACIADYLGPITGETVSRRVAHTICEAMYDCCDPTPSLPPSEFGQLSILARYDYTSCVVGIASALERENLAIGRILAARVPPLAQLNQSGLEAIAAAYTADDCLVEVFDSEALIDGLVTGLTPAGDECAGDYVCIEGTVCTDADGDDAICRAPGGDGGTCIGDKDCIDGFYCPAGTCTAQQAEGLGCTQNDQCVDGTSCVGSVCVTTGTTCDSDQHSDCEATQYCDAGNCVDRKTEGMPCGDNDECDEDLYCPDGAEATCTRTAHICDLFHMSPKP